MKAQGFVGTQRKRRSVRNVKAQGFVGTQKIEAGLGIGKLKTVVADEHVAND